MKQETTKDFFQYLIPIFSREIFQEENGDLPIANALLDICTRCGVTITLDFARQCVKEYAQKGGATN